MYVPVHSGKEVKTTLSTRDLKQDSYASKMHAWALQNKVEREFDATYIYSVPIQNELVLYGNNVYELFVNLMTPEFDGEYNPMFFKYMSYKLGHWEVETHLIYQYIESKVKSNTLFANLVNSNLKLKTDLGTELRAILNGSFDLSNSTHHVFTNKTRRLIKK